MNTKGFQQGQSLVEAIIAMAILSITIFGVSSYLVNAQSFSFSTQEKASCRVYAEALVGDFSDTSSLNIINYIPGSVDASGSPQLRNPALPTSRLETTYFDATTQISGNFQNLENGMTRAYQAYMRDRGGYCGGFKEIQAGVNDTVLNSPSLINSINNDGFKAYIQLVPWVLKSATYTNPISDCLANYDFHPLNKTSAAENIGLLVKIKVANPTTNQTCQAERVITYVTDVAPPTGTAPNSPPCNSGAITIPLTASEPGVEFVCSSPSTPGYSLCQNLTSIGSETYSLTVNNPGAGQGPTSAALNINNFPSNTTRDISVEAVDTAGNSNSIGTVSVFCPASACTNGATQDCGSLLGMITDPNGVYTQVCSSGVWGGCALTSCVSGYTLNGGACVADAICGSANGQAYSLSTPPDTSILCASGSVEDPATFTPTNISDWDGTVIQTGWSWTCTTTNGGGATSCLAYTSRRWSSNGTTYCYPAAVSLPGSDGPYSSCTPANAVRCPSPIMSYSDCSGAPGSIYNGLPGCWNALGSSWPGEYISCRTY